MCGIATCISSHNIGYECLGDCLHVYLNTTLIVTLCTYAQLGYQFDCVGLCMCVYVSKKLSCLVPYRSKKSCCVLYYLLMNFKRLQNGILCPVSCTDEAICCCFFLNLAMEYCIMVVCHVSYATYVAAQRGSASVT